MNALAKLTGLSLEEKTRRGLLHTPAEIAQQPRTWKSTVSIFQGHREALAAFLNEAGFGNSLQPMPTVFLIGAGTSDYVGRCLAPLLRRLWKCEVSAVPSTSLLTHEEEWLIPGRKYLWISFSRSGDSPEGVAVISNALERHPDIRHIVVSCNPDGSMLRFAADAPQVFAIALDNSVNDQGLAMTSSFTNMIVFGQCMAYIHDIAQYEPTLQRMVKAGELFLADAADAAEALSAEPYERVCFVGSGALEGVAVESGLKVLELTAGKILTLCESAMGLRHGPMAALDKTTLLVAFVANNEKVARYEKDLLEELTRKDLVKTQVAIGGHFDLSSNGFARRHISLDAAVPDDCRPPIDVLFGQLLGLFFSLRCDLLPDQPSPDGAISRVVQNVRIYA